MPAEPHGLQEEQNGQHRRVRVCTDMAESSVPTEMYPMETEQQHPKIPIEDAARLVLSEQWRTAE